MGLIRRIRRYLKERRAAQVQADFKRGYDWAASTVEEFRVKEGLNPNEFVAKGVDLIEVHTDNPFDESAFDRGAQQFLQEYSRRYERPQLGENNVH